MRTCPNGVSVEVALCILPQVRTNCTCVGGGGGAVGRRSPAFRFKIRGRCFRPPLLSSQLCSFRQLKRDHMECKVASISTAHCGLWRRWFSRGNVVSMVGESQLGGPAVLLCPSPHMSVSGGSLFGSDECGW